MMRVLPWVRNNCYVYHHYTVYHLQFNNRKRIMKYVRYMCLDGVLNTDLQTVLLVSHCYILYTTFYQCSFVVVLFSCYNM